MNSLEQFHQLTTKELLTTSPDVFADARTLTASSANWGTIQKFEPNELTFDNKIWSNVSSPSEPQLVADGKAAESLRYPLEDRATRELREKLFEQDPNMRREWWEKRSEDARHRYWQCQEEHASKIPDGFEQNKWINRQGAYGNDCQLDDYGYGYGYYGDVYQAHDRNSNYPNPGRPITAPTGGFLGPRPGEPVRPGTFTPPLELETNWKPNTTQAPPRDQSLTSGW